MIVYKCDCCGSEIPIIKKTDIFGIEREVLDLGILKCKEYDFKIVNNSLDTLMCKSCAEKYSAQIDYELKQILNNKERNK